MIIKDFPHFDSIVLTIENQSGKTGISPFHNIPALIE